ncbi:MAG TPA: lasso peptide isopeptide bond-forming cyclase [Synechococcales cyanobacterium M55_K2018_004]|nr:lasso peptide isopeptide bond-forming cyclase [Synechococcales cyanobacterium M55_K2018_004]
MSAIAGIYNYGSDRPVDCAHLSGMIDTLAHRGGDGHGIWCEGAIGLGHRMLWTTPESLLEQLPMTRGRLTITADARIDNREELIETLDLRHYPAEKLTDSDLILAAYQRWGEACPEKLLGDFAFAIWDAQQQTLFCARDIFGVRPFYYCTVGRVFRFASEIKALFCCPEVPRQLNEAKIGEYLEVCLADKCNTFYQHIWRLPPAHSLTVKAAGLQLRTYWTPDPRTDLRLKSPQDYADAFLEVFTEAVRCRLRSAFPLGSTLSGGLDSSSIVCLARLLLAQQQSPPLKTFSAIFDATPECDERPFINAVLRQGGLEPTFVDASALSPLTELERVLWHQDEPFCTPNLYIHWGLYTAAQQQGVRVFLDGYLGDNVVYHGWSYREDLAHSLRWIKLAQVIQGTVQRSPHVSFWSLFWDYAWNGGIRPRIPEPVLRFRRWLLGYPEPTRRLRATTNPEFAQRIGLCDRLQALEKQSTFPGLRPSRQKHYLNLVSGDIPIGLEVANKASAAFGIESRFPFTDRRVVQLCLAIPSEQRLENGLSRMFLRRAMVNLLPPEVCWRDSKGDLSSNFDRGLRELEGDRLEQVLVKEVEQFQPYVNLPALHRAYEAYKSRPSGGEIPSVWLVLSLALWLNFANHLSQNAHSDRISRLG